jgi:hypothetical protein
MRGVSSATACVVLFVLVVAVPGCDRSGARKTQLTGVLILGSGQNADVRNCRVRLYDSSDLADPPLYQVFSYSRQFSNTSVFEFEDLTPGDYYLLAWKDVHDDGQVGFGDIVGVYGGEYRPGHGGDQITVVEHNTTDLGDVAVSLYGFGETMLVGTLVLQTGGTGDVRSSSVELHQSPDLTDEPVKVVMSEQGSDSARSGFEVRDVLPGSYYLLGWKDLDSDGEISDKDVVGVHGGEYRPGYGGTPVTLRDEMATDAGEIVVLRYRELIISASGARSQGGTLTDFEYSFNYDVELNSLIITFPEYGPVEDPDAPGHKTAGSIHRSEGWNAGGSEMPTGDHNLNFRGFWEGQSFDIDVVVAIN